jgi:hypothetical protein
MVYQNQMLKNVDSMEKVDGHRHSPGSLFYPTIGLYALFLSTNFHPVPGHDTTKGTFSFLEEL